MFIELKKGKQISLEPEQWLDKKFYLIVFNRIELNQLLVYSILKYDFHDISSKKSS
jgi:hypothetical protein